MLAIDITKIINSFPIRRGPGVAQLNILRLLKNEPIILIFGRKYIGSQVYFRYIKITDVEHVKDIHGNFDSGKVYSLKRKIFRYVLARLGLEVEILKRANKNYDNYELINASKISRIISFFQEDEIWRLNLQNIKKYLVLYDLTFFDILNSRTNQLEVDEYTSHIQKHILNTIQALSVANKILVPSQYLKNRLINEIGVDERKIEIIIISTNEKFYNNANSIKNTKQDKINFKYYSKKTTKRKIEVLVEDRKTKILIISGFDGFSNDNKGIGKILDIAKIIDLKFKNKYIFEFIISYNQDFIERVNILKLENIQYFHSLEDNILRNHLSKADYLLVNSIDEGFCLPILEAILLKKRVIASRIPTLIEIWGEKINYINPWNRYAAANEIINIIEKDDYSKIENNYTYAINNISPIKTLNSFIKVIYD